MNAKNLIELLSTWLTSARTAALKYLPAQAEEAGYEVGSAMRKRFEDGLSRGLLENPKEFGTNVIYVEPQKRVTQRKARGGKK